MSDRFQALRQIAPKLNQLSEDPSARVGYELMSGGLIWSDELPPLDQEDPREYTCLRALWRFRSTLIMGEPEEKFRPTWEEARKLFPLWPGFRSERQLAIWRQTFMEQRDKLLADMDALDARCNRHECEKPAATA